jgi:hypothetical protein
MGLIEDELLQLIPTAEQAREKIAQATARRLMAERKQLERAAAEKRALAERLQKPSAVSDAQALRIATGIIQRAVTNGQHSVEVYRFPSKSCTDHGVAIANQDPGWARTLEGAPKEIHAFWERRLRDRGYRLVCQIADFSNGTLGDVSLSLKWSQ